MVRTLSRLPVRHSGRPARRGACCASRATKRTPHASRGEGSRTATRRYAAQRQTACKGCRLIQPCASAYAGSLPSMLYNAGRRRNMPVEKREDIQSENAGAGEQGTLLAAGGEGTKARQGGGNEPRTRCIHQSNVAACLRVMLPARNKQEPREQGETIAASRTAPA